MCLCMFGRLSFCFSCKNFDSLWFFFDIGGEFQILPSRSFVLIYALSFDWNLSLLFSLRGMDFLQISYDFNLSLLFSLYVMDILQWINCLYVWVDAIIFMKNFSWKFVKSIFLVFLYNFFCFMWSRCSDLRRMAIAAI